MILLDDTGLQLQKALLERHRYECDLSALKTVDEIEQMSVEHRMIFKQQAWLACARTKLFASSQKYGAAIEKRLIDVCGLKKVSRKANAGDAADHNDKSFELKGSLSVDGSFNLVQIRPWQKIDFFSLLFFDSGDVDDKRDAELMLCHRVPGEYIVEYAREHGGIAHSNGEELRVTIERSKDHGFFNFVSKFDLLNPNYSVYNVTQQWKNLDFTLSELHS